MNDYRFNAPFAKEKDTPHVSVLLDDFLTIVREYVEHCGE